MKRKAEYDLDRKELEANDFDMPAQPEGQSQTTSGFVDTSQRRIVKLKPPSEVLAEKQAAKAGQFILAESLTTVTTTLTSQFPQQTQQAPISFLSKSITPSDKDNTQAAKPQTPIQTDTTSKPLFNLSGLNGTRTQNTTAPATQETKKDEPAKVSLFAGLFSGSSGSTGSLLDNSNSLFSKTGGLFNTNALGLGGVQPNGLLSSIFANLPKDEKKEEKLVEEKPVEKPKTGGLFANFLNTNLNPTTASLFAKVSEAPTTFKSLLSNENAPKSFFQSYTKDEDDEGDDGEDGGEGGERSPSPEPDPSQTDNFKYDDHFEKIIAKEIDKFKVNQNPLLGKGTISLNKAKDSDNYFIIFRNPAKLIQYQGQLIKKLSKVNNMSNKADTLIIWSFSAQKPAKDAETGDKKEEVQKSKIVKDDLKLMFTNYDACSEFKAAVEKVI